MRKIFSPAIGGLAFIIIVIGSYVIVAQDAVTGTWKASARNEDSGQIHLSFSRASHGGKSMHGSSYALSDLVGLSAQQAQNGSAAFRLVREAGTIECEGIFASGSGSGTFRFIPNQSFIDGMKSRGFDFERSSDRRHGGDLSDRLFTAAAVNVTTALADNLRSANFGPLDIDDLFKAAIFKINGEFMAEMKATGFPNLGMEELVKARIFKIDAAYVRKTREMGFNKEDFESLVKFRIFKVTPEFLSMLQSEGFGDLPSEDVVKFRIFNIDQAFIREAKSAEPNITVAGLVERKIGIRR